MFLTFRFLLLSAVAASALSAASAPSSGLRAGASTTNITPPLGTLIVGGFAPFPAQGSTMNSMRAASCSTTAARGSRS